jgi:predicted Rossmann fold flavoprotein
METGRTVKRNPKNRDLPSVSRDQESAGNVTRTDVAVIGGGPAGLMAALAASERGANVVLCEQLDRAGVKLLATGGGHCNLSNVLPESEFMARFGRQGRFMHPALKAMSQQGLRDFFSRIGVPTHSPDGFKILPVSNSAKTVQEALVRRCREQSVEMRVGVTVKTLTVAAGAMTGLVTDQGSMAASRVILATGGKSYPELGATGAGFEMAQQVGHRLVKTLPALVPLVAENFWIRTLTGVTLPEAKLWINLPKHRESTVGSVLFTHRGVSGPAALDISGAVSALLEERESVPLCLNILPHVSPHEWEERFERWHEEEGRKQVATLLDWYLPSSLARLVCELAEIPHAMTASTLSRGLRQKLLQRLTALELTIAATEGFEQAMVTRGGVGLKEVNPDTLESRIVRGLFFAGEILDLDGPTGGFNLQWAFSSGFLAGISAAVTGRPSAAKSV